MGLYDELLGRNAKIIAGGAAQNTARGAQVCMHICNCLAGDAVRSRSTTVDIVELKNK